MRYSIEPRDRIYVKGHGFLSFAKNVINMAKNLLVVLKNLQQMQQKQHGKEQFKKQQNQLVI